MLREAVEHALDVFRPGLDADGFELRTGAVEDDGDVQVVLRAREDACLECLVPDELMVQMLDDAIRRHAPALGHLELVREGFEGLEAH